MKRTPLKPKPFKAKKTPIAKVGARTKRIRTPENKFRAAVRKRYPECVQCNTTGNEFNPLQTAHILGKASLHSHIRLEVDNAVTLCQNCHTYFTDHPRGWEYFIEKFLPGRLAYLGELERELSKMAAIL